MKCFVAWHDPKPQSIDNLFDKDTRASSMVARFLRQVSLRPSTW